jgi:uncharacterized membrane protein
MKYPSITYFKKVSPTIKQKGFIENPRFFLKKKSSYQSIDDREASENIQTLLRTIQEKDETIKALQEQIQEFSQSISTLSQQKQHESSPPSSIEQFHVSRSCFFSYGRLMMYCFHAILIHPSFQKTIPHMSILFQKIRDFR